MDRILAEIEAQESGAEDRQAALSAYLEACDTLGINKTGRAARRIWQKTQRISAILLIPLAAGLAYMTFSKEESSQPQWAEITVPAAQTQDILLQDGSRLTVSAGSRVTYPDAFKGETRDIFLDGEVMAEIAKNPEHPFIIHSGNLAVKVYGTKFNFKTYSRSDFAEVLLMEGSISLDVQTESGLKTIPLTPGEYVNYNKSTGIIEKSKLDEDSIGLLTDGQTLKFRDIPLKEVAAELSRRFGEEIIICDPALEQTKLYAIYSNGENLEEILSNISVSLGHASLTHNGNIWLINSR